MQSSRRTFFLRVAIAAGLLVFVAAGLRQISFDVDILKLLPVHLKQVQGLSVLLKEFVSDNELIITVEAPTAEVAEADALCWASSALPALPGRPAQHSARVPSAPPLPVCIGANL